MKQAGASSRKAADQARLRATGGQRSPAAREEIRNEREYRQPCPEAKSYT